MQHLALYPSQTEYVLPEQLDTAKLPGYNEQVRSVRVSGYNAPPLDFLDSFPFLHTISYLPLDLAPTGSSVLLASLARLENLELSSGLFTTDDSVGPLLDCSFEKLRNLTISSPNRALLNVLPLWIARLGRLRGLHLLVLVIYSFQNQALSRFLFRITAAPSLPAFCPPCSPRSFKAWIPSHWAYHTP